VEPLTSLIEALGTIPVVLTVLLSVITSAHVVLYKRDSRAAVGWVGLVWLAPVVGSALYALLGINRIRRQAAEQRAQSLLGSAEFPRLLTSTKSAPLPADVQQLHTLAELVDRVAGRPLTGGNAVAPLLDGDESFPRMIEAIDAAQRTVALSTYIFDSDYAGGLFVDALQRAVRRGVAVRVLIDTVGARYSRPYIVKELKHRGVPCARFGRTLLPWRMPYMNLRNHRKILIADGRVGFTGGINIREGHLLDRSPPSPVQDLHFQVEGPVVGQLMRTFAEDWAYTTHEQLGGEDWFPALEPVGGVPVRFGIVQLKTMSGGTATESLGRDELEGANVIAASESCLGNGVRSDLEDVVFLKPEAFDRHQTRTIAAELDAVNRGLLDEGRSAVFIGFGRWGTTDDRYGVPVRWGQISSAQVIVEITLPDAPLNLSQGTHFFHHLLSQKVLYLSVEHDGATGVHLDRLGAGETVWEGRYVRHLRLDRPLDVVVDGASRRGVIR